MDFKSVWLEWGMGSVILCINPSAKALYVCSILELDRNKVI